MSFLLGQSTAFEELRQAVSDAFDPALIETFLQGLSLTGIKIRDFDNVLPEFSNVLGGAYRRGSTFSTSANELFRRMDRTEQEILKKYFHELVEQLSADARYSDLLHRFHSIF